MSPSQTSKDLELCAVLITGYMEHLAHISYSLPYALLRRGDLFCYDLVSLITNCF